MNKYRLRRIGVASNASATRPTLSDCIELVLAHVDALVGDVLDALKAPYPASGNDACVGDGANPEVKAAVMLLVTEASAVRAMFSSELRRLVYQSGSRDLGQSPLERVEDIRVFDVRELEVHIEHALARQEVIRAVDDVMPLFDALVSALLGWTSVQSGLNPLKPEAFERALRETLQAWVPDQDVRMALLRPASIALGAGLRQLLREACDWLLSQGVDPVVALDSRTRDGAAARADLSGSEVERTMATLDKLRRLLLGEARGSAGGANHDFTNTVPASLFALQDLKLVEPMMKRLAERSAKALVQASANPVRRADTVPEVRTQAQNQQIGRQLGEEVVRFMLDQLVHDERLLAPVRAQMRALEPVLVRLANSDPRFFIDRAHPARQLLDRVAQRSLPYGREDEDGVAGFVACVANAVRLLAQGPGDAPDFAFVLEQLEQDWTAFEAMRRRLQEEVLNARKHAEQRVLLAQRFSAAMMERFKNAGLPELVASFLRGPWSQVLAESHLRNGEDSPDPHGYLALVDDLVWSVQLPLIRRDHARLVRLIPRLLARLNEGLVLIRYPQEPISIFLDALSALHDKVLEDHRRAVAAARDMPAAPSAPQSQAPAATVRAPAAVPERRVRVRPAQPLFEGVLSPRDLMLGAWVDLMLGGGWVRAQLTWISHNRNLFMFVSGAGLAHAMSRRTMDRLETQGRLRVAGAASAVDLELEEAATPAGGSDPSVAPDSLPAPQ